MLGAIIGDIAGSRFEFNNHRSKDFIFFSDDCCVTDDSIMTLSVAKAIIACEGNYDRLGEFTVKYMQGIGRQYPNCGYGGMFGQWMFSEEPEPYNSFGNGAAMRVSACGFAAQTEEDAKCFSRAVTEVTHSHPEGIKGAEAVSIAIFMAKNGATKHEIRERIVNDYYTLDFTIDEIRDAYEFNETCQDTVPQAVVAFLESESFEDAIRNAISIGGDSDTLAAIAGSIAEAYYGIPKDIEKATMKFLDDKLRGLYREWKKFIRVIYTPKKLKFITKYSGKLDIHGSIKCFVNEFYLFSLQHSEYDLNNFIKIFQKNEIKWTEESMRSIDTENFDDTVVLSLIMGVFRAEHFSSGVIENFYRDGVLTKWLERLQVIDNESVAEPERPDILVFQMDLQRGVRKESLKVTPHELIITGLVGEMGKITHRYEYDEGIYAEIALRVLEEAGYALASDGWLDTGDFSIDGNYTYVLAVQYDDETTVKRQGIYNRAHIPEKPWKELIKIVQVFLNMFGYGDFINLDLFMNALKPGEVKYCGVEFSESGKIYHYRTNDMRIVIGDTVVVPVGEDNYEREAIVETIEICRWDNTPHPLEKTKQILRKVGDNFCTEPAQHLLENYFC